MNIIKLILKLLKRFNDWGNEQLKDIHPDNFNIHLF